MFGDLEELSMTAAGRKILANNNNQRGSAIERVSGFGRDSDLV